MKIIVEHTASIAEVTYVSDFPADAVIAKLFEAFEETPFTPNYDWLIDIQVITSNVSTEDLLTAASAWNELAKGRDVGKRTAIVCKPDLVASLSETLISALPFRSVCIFTDRDKATVWLQAAKTEDDRGYQFI